MRIYTKTGDKGETSLIGGQRVPKDDLRVEAYGIVDELNAMLGIVAASTRDRTLIRILKRLQNELFILGADLASPDAEVAEKRVSTGGRSRPRQTAGQSIPRIAASHAEALESIIDTMDSKLPPLKHFILPGGHRLAAELHLARAICRRAERAVVRLARSRPRHEGEMNRLIIVYVNRLSDLLFVLARWVNREQGKKEIRWEKP